MGNTEKKQTIWIKSLVCFRGLMDAPATMRETAPLVQLKPEPSTRYGQLLASPVCTLAKCGSWN